MNRFQILALCLAISTGCKKSGESQSAPTQAATTVPVPGLSVPERKHIVILTQNAAVQVRKLMTDDQKSKYLRVSVSKEGKHLLYLDQNMDPRDDYGSSEKICNTTPEE